MPTIILNNPQMGENIGAAARSMRNFGLNDLRLVKPRDGWPNSRATATGAGALEKMNVQVFDTLAQSIADLNFAFATTVRPRDMVKPVFTPEDAAAEGIARRTKKQNIGFVFGAERSGLGNDDISQCQAIISIPTNPDFSSLNLGQSVLLMAYEWMKAQRNNSQTISGRPPLDMGDSFPAKQSDLHKFIKRLENELDERKFFRAKDLKPTMQINIQNIFTRADISDQELRTLHGILSALRGNKTDNKTPK
ncbi:MAG: rRNA methyltransferase [Zetaproteobacteria bacterium]|nr:MAG: rRNA methyltransferase [Zetaproteobacteria bacterium]